MTGPPRRRPDDGAEELRRALGHAASRLPEPGSMVGAVHELARRKRRRRNAVAGGGATLVALVAVAGVAGGLPLPGGPRPAPAPPAVAQPTRPPAPAPTPGETTTRASGTRAVVPPSTPAQGRTETAGRPDVEDGFGGTAIDRGRWTFLYDGGPSSPLATWSARDAGVAGGHLRLTVSQGAGGATTGGIGAAGSAAENGRWEVRWRMTGGQGVVGQLALVTAGTEGTDTPPAYLATLEPSAGRVVFADATGGTHAEPVDAAAFHTVALELTADGVRWLVDGRQAVRWPRPAAAPVWPALQTLLVAPAELPRTLEVDRFRFFAG